jgi:hypothetical protein
VLRLLVNGRPAKSKQVAIEVVLVRHYHLLGVPGELGARLRYSAVHDVSSCLWTSCPHLLRIAPMTEGGLSFWI